MNKLIKIKYFYIQLSFIKSIRVAEIETLLKVFKFLNYELPTFEGALKAILEGDNQHAYVVDINHYVDNSKKAEFEFIRFPRLGKDARMQKTLQQGLYIIQVASQCKILAFNTTIQKDNYGIEKKE